MLLLHLGLKNNSEKIEFRFSRAEGFFNKLSCDGPMMVLPEIFKDRRRAIFSL